MIPPSRVLFGTNCVPSTEGGSTSLLSGGGVFTGTGVICKDFQCLISTVQSNVGSATNGFVLQFSQDNSTWYTAAEGTLTAGSALTLVAICSNKWARVRYTNGASAQSTFFIYSILSDQTGAISDISGGGSTTVEMGDIVTMSIPPNATSNFQFVRNLNVFPNRNNTVFQNIPIVSGNGVPVSVVNPVTAHQDFVATSYHLLFDFNFRNGINENTMGTFASGNATVTFEDAGFYDGPGVAISIANDAADAIAAIATRRYFEVTPAMPVRVLMNVRALSETATVGNARWGLYNQPLPIHSTTTVPIDGNWGGFWWSWDPSSNEYSVNVSGTNVNFNEDATNVTQSNWNIDTMNGANNAGNPTGINLTSSTRIEQFVIEIDILQCAKFGIMRNGEVYYCHRIPLTGSINSLFIAHYRAPITFMLQRTAQHAQTAINFQLWAGSISYAGVPEKVPWGIETPARGTFSISSTALKSITTEEPVLSLRLLSGNTTIRRVVEPWTLSSMCTNTAAALQTSLYMCRNSNTITSASWALVSGGNSTAQWDESGTALPASALLLSRRMWTGGTLEMDLTRVEPAAQLYASVNGRLSDVCVVTTRSLDSVSQDVFTSLDWKERNGLL